MAWLAGNAPAAADPQVVTIERSDCERLVRYVPDAEVSAVYTPGVDVRGKPVAPADLYGATPIRLPDTFVFTIQVDPFDTDGERTLESERRVLASQLAADPNNQSLRDRLAVLDRRAARLDGRPQGATVLPLGEVAVTQDGRVYYNGQPLQDEEQWTLAQQCRDALQPAR